MDARALNKKYGPNSPQVKVLTKWSLFFAAFRRKESSDRALSKLYYRRSVYMLAHHIEARSFDKYRVNLGSTLAGYHREMMMRAWDKFMEEERDLFAELVLTM